MKNADKKDLESFLIHLIKHDPKLYSRLQTLGCKLNDNSENVVFCLATFGVHFAEEDWEGFLKHTKTYKALLGFM